MPSPVTPDQDGTDPLSPELVPIVTLLSSQVHRRYHDGVLLVLEDLKNDGTPAERKWKEVYGVLIGTQLALWDAKELAGGPQHHISEYKLKQLASKPTYINFTDAILKTLDSQDNVVTESNQRLDNVLVVSTTLKNRYFLQYSNKESFNQWNAAIRLSVFECTSLQEAYTGAFISSRGSRLGDIKILLADTKFKYEDWVSVRFGPGMPWKRCYAVISQGTGKEKKGKMQLGEINFYENDKKIKKANSMTTVTGARAIYAVYPSSPRLIDESTIIKLEGSITMGKKEEPQESSLFIMPEKHNAVPGYDTIIRFLIPAMNAFKLYGRPKRLTANKDDPESLLFALPVLPCIYYLNVEDLYPMVNSSSSMYWTNYEWREQIRGLLQRKLTSGYSGCGSTSDLTMSVMSPVIGSSELFDGPSSPIMSPLLNHSRQAMRSNPGSNERLAVTTERNISNPMLRRQITPNEQENNSKIDNTLGSAPLYHTNTNRLKENVPRASSPLGQPETTRNIPAGMKLNIVDSNFEKFDDPSTNPYRKTSPKKKSDLSRHNTGTSDLFDLYTDYSTEPFGMSSSVTKDKRHNKTEEKTNPFSHRARQISPRKQNSVPVDDISKDLADIDVLGSGEDLLKDLNLNGDFSGKTIMDNNDTNVFDPDFMEQDQLLQSEQLYKNSAATTAARRQPQMNSHSNVENNSSKNIRRPYPEDAYGTNTSKPTHQTPVTPVDQVQRIRLPPANNSGFRQQPAQGPAQPKPQQLQVEMGNPYRTRPSQEPTPQQINVPSHPGSKLHQRPPNGFSPNSMAPNYPNRGMPPPQQQQQHHPSNLPKLPPHQNGPYNNYGKQSPYNPQGKRIPPAMHNPYQQHPQYMPNGPQMQQRPMGQYRGPPPSQAPHQALRSPGYPPAFPHGNRPPPNQNQAYPPPVPSNNIKPTKPGGGGFSQFMPPSQSNNNPYSH